MKNTLALTAMVLTIILAFLAVTGAFPARRRIYSCNYSVVSNKESCWVSAVYWDDGWMFKAK